MSNEIIDTIEEEATNLELHTKLCAQRYQQLINKFDVVDSRLDKIEGLMIEIKKSLVSSDEEKLKKYLSWAGVIITSLVAVCIHFLTK